MKKIYSLLLAAVATIMLGVSCTPEVDDTFSESAAHRVETNITTLKSTLESSPNGWLMRMYGDLDFGGYNVFLQFADNKVTVMNEVYGPTQTTTTHYKIEQSAGVVLSFDEYNELFHFFADPVNPAGFGDNGRGFYGDLEFRVITATADSIVMTGKKHGRRIVMTPATGDWTTYVNQVAMVEEGMFSSRYYKLTVGDKQFDVTKSHRNLAIYDAETGMTTEMPFIVTPSGVEFYNATEFAGVTLKGFNFDGDDSFSGIDGNYSLAHYTMPLVNQFVQTTSGWYFSLSGSSRIARVNWNNLKSLYDSNDIGLYMLAFGGDLVDEGDKRFGASVIMSLDGTRYFGKIVFDYTFESDNVITLSTSGDGTANGPYFYNNLALQRGLDQFNGTFELSTDDIDNPTYIQLTNTKNKNIWYRLSADGIVNPLEN